MRKYLELLWFYLSYGLQMLVIYAGIPVLYYWGAYQLFAPCSTVAAFVIVMVGFPIFAFTWMLVDSIPVGDDEDI